MKKKELIGNTKEKKDKLQNGYIKVGEDTRSRKNN